MKPLRSILTVAWLFTASSCFGQNWQQIGDFNDVIRVMYDDTISDQLYLSGNFRFNGIDTVDGLCAFNGKDFASSVRRSDCVSFGCSPSFLIARYKEQLYFSGPNLKSINGTSDINGIAKLDGDSWVAGMPGLHYKENDNPYLDSYYVHDDNFYGVGFFRTAHGDTCNSVAYWNGIRWTGLSFPTWVDNEVPRVSLVSFF